MGAAAPGGALCKCRAVKEAPSNLPSCKNITFSISQTAGVPVFLFLEPKIHRNLVNTARIAHLYENVKREKQDSCKNG